MKLSGWPAALTLFSSCIYSSQAGRALENRVAVLEAGAQSAAQDVAEAKALLAKEQDRAVAAAAKSEATARESVAGSSVQVDRAMETVANLRGQVETLQFRLMQLEARPTVPAPVSQPTPSPATPAAATAAASSPAPEVVQLPNDPTEALLLAGTRIRDQPNVGRRLYNEYLKRWPDNPQGSQAHFALAESYFGEVPPRCREALYEYGRVIQDFPTSAAAPLSYLKSADCFEQLNMAPEARLALESVRSKFPGTEAARAAQRRLALKAKPVTRAKP